MAWVAPTMAAPSPIARCRKPPILALAYISPARSSKRRMSIILASSSRAVFLSGRSCEACSTPVSSGFLARVASLVATASEGTRYRRLLSARASVDAGQVDHEHERLVGADVWRRSLGAVRELGRDDQLPPSAHPHPRHALVPSRDHAAGAERELEGLRTAAPRGVELLAVLVEHAHVLDAEVVARLCRRALALHQILDLERLGRGAGGHGHLGLVGEGAGGLERRRGGCGLGGAVLGGGSLLGATRPAAAGHGEGADAYGRYEGGHGAHRRRNPSDPRGGTTSERTSLRHW